MGNAPDKVRGLRPMAGHFGWLCGRERMRADGNVLETGGGPAGKNKERHACKGDVGRYLGGLIAPSRPGFVVKAGIWAKSAPGNSVFALLEY